ncbi:unnamed protein product, partial [marine sediment metagenome]
VYLGPIGGGIDAEILPVVKYIGAAPDFPVTIDPQTEEAKMSDGSRRWAFFSGVIEWGLGWGYLTLAQLNTLLAKVDLKQILKFRNDFVDVTEYDVVITAFSYEPVFPGIRYYQYYKADMTVRQA